MQYFQQNSQRVIPVVSVTGNKNSGKTTAIEDLVAELGRKGYRIGTLKHCHCDMQMDQPGKDSWRHRKAGSAGTAVIGPEEIALIADRPLEEDPERLAAWLFSDSDLVLAEGFHWVPLPRIEILDANGTTREANPNGHVLAQLSHRFDTDEIVRVAELLCARFSKSVSALA